MMNREQAATAITLDLAQELLEELALARVFGFRVRALEPGVCVLAAPFDELFLRPGELVSGPIYMALADAAVWLALMTLAGPARMAVTSEITTNFLHGAVRRDVICTARIIAVHDGLADAVAACADDEGTLLAHHTATYSLPPGVEVTR
ncbi:PaaI family thioesterase [bacterium]|nr:MAG: PaaI family thioesterase [bacterium]